MRPNRSCEFSPTGPQIPCPPLPSPREFVEALERSGFFHQGPILGWLGKFPHFLYPISWNLRNHAEGTIRLVLGGPDLGFIFAHPAYAYTKRVLVNLAAQHRLEMILPAKLEVISSASGFRSRFDRILPLLRKHPKLRTVTMEEELHCRAASNMWDVTDLQRHGGRILVCAEDTNLQRFWWLSDNFVIHASVWSGFSIPRDAEAYCSNEPEEVESFRQQYDDLREKTTPLSNFQLERQVTPLARIAAQTFDKWCAPISSRLRLLRIIRELRHREFDR